MLKNGLGNPIEVNPFNICDIRKRFTRMFSSWILLYGEFFDNR